MKLISINEYNSKLNDQDMSYIKKVEMKYSKLSKIIVY